LLLGFGDGFLVRFQGLLGGDKVFLRCLQLIFLLQGTCLFSLQLGGGGRELVARLPNLAGHLFLLQSQEGVQLLASLFPLRLALLGQAFLVGLLAEALLVATVRLGLHLGEVVLGLEHGDDLGTAIQHQQQEDQRPHRAEQHRKEGEGGNLQVAPPPSHAAAPGLAPSRLG